MISIKNVLRIQVFGYEELNAIKAMAHQLSKVSNLKVPMILYLEGTQVGDLSFFDPDNSIEPLQHGKSNLDIITVSSGTLDFVGTCLAIKGTDKRFATKDAKFTLNPELFSGESTDETVPLIDYDTAKGFAKGFVDWNTQKALELLLGKEFGVSKAQNLGIITKVNSLEDVVEDKDCAESWEDIYISSFWGF